MRDPARIDRVVEKLRVVWRAHPDLRLGQLVDYLCFCARRSAGSAAPQTFSVEDDVVEAELDREVAQIRAP